MVEQSNRIEVVSKTTGGKKPDQKDASAQIRHLQTPMSRSLFNASGYQETWANPDAAAALPGLVRSLFGKFKRKQG